MNFSIRERFIIKIPKFIRHSHPIWFHCASVGEFNTAKILIKRIKERGNKVVVTYFSSRAKVFMESKAKKEVDWVGVLPLDIPFLISRFNKILSPKILIVVEREFWPFLLTRTNSPKLLINTYAKGNLMERILIKKFDHIIARTEKDKEIFLKEGASSVSVCGNLKLVFENPSEPRKLNEVKEKLLVAGSTHEGEEEIIFELYIKLKKLFKDLKLVIAPRHITRADKVKINAESLGLKPVLRTDNKDSWEVLILNTLGELNMFYRTASIAFVGGTFVPVGGHNISEPCRYDVPVFFGNHISKVRDMAEILEKAGLGFKVSSIEEAFNVCIAALKGELEYEKGFMRKLSKSVEDCYMRIISNYI